MNKSCLNCEYTVVNGPHDILCVCDESVKCGECMTEYEYCSRWEPRTEPPTSELSGEITSLTEHTVAGLITED